MYKSTVKNLFKSNMWRYIRRFSNQTPLLSSYKGGVVRKTLSDIHQLYKSGKYISMITAHDFITSKMVEKSGADINLIGDSLAMTTLGYKDTNEVTLEEFLYHVKAVQRGNKSSFLIADIPFGTYEISVEQAVETAIKLVKLGQVQAVKIEGGNPYILPSIEKIINAGIPVMGHVGLTPQKHNSMGGFKLQGNSVLNALNIYQECLNLQSVGCFSIVLECIPNKLAKFITENLSIPTIGIGAGPYCSGQVLVISDILGMINPNEYNKPKFVKEYSNFFNIGVQALDNYVNDVNSGKYPHKEIHGYKIKKEVLEEFQKRAKSLV